jgi:hypothetical protein
VDGGAGFGEEDWVVKNQQTAEGKPKVRGINPASLANLTGGSRKGIPNKAGATMKAAIQSVYDKLQDEAGGDHAHFLQWAKDNDTEFYKLASKLIPVQNELSGPEGSPLGIAVVLRKPDPAA